MKLAPTSTYLARSGLDSFLSGMAGCFATYSMFMSIGKDALAVQVSVCVAFAAALGYLISTRLRKTRFINWDSWLLTAAAFGLMFAIAPINNSLGDEAIPPNILAGLYFSLLLVVGNLFAWRDPTMLMLSVPCISLFAYVGIFDAWRPAIVLFFIFLIAVAVLYSRSFLRVMVQRAQNLGAEPDLLKRDVWKWVAGPEWAFASAAVVIVVSVIVGPLLQLGFAPVAGSVKISTPTSRINVQTAVQQSSEARVGTSAPNLTDAPVFKVKADQLGYFRRKVYFDFNGDGWNSTPSNVNINSLLVPVPDPAGGTKLENSEPSPYEEITKPERVRYTVEFVDKTMVYLPEPGVITHVDADPMDVTLDRSSVEISAIRKNEPVTFDADLASGDPGNKPASVPGPFPSRSSTSISPVVAALANEAIQGARTDYDKCRAITRFIGERCKYNIMAPAIPTGKDKVEYFLNESKEGYCDMFATAFVVMARAVGIQARYAVGWHADLGGKLDEKGFRTVIEKDSHAWAEVYFRGTGWKVFDGTSFAEDISPQRGQGERAKANFQIPWQQVTPVLGGLAALVGLGALAYRYRKYRISSGSPLSLLLAEQSRLQFAIEGLVRHPRRFSQSISEFVGLHKSSLSSAAPECLSLAKDFETAFFSGQPVDSAEVSRFQTRTSAVLKELREVKRALERTRRR